MFLYKLSFYTVKKKVYFNNFWSKEMLVPELFLMPLILKCLDADLEIGTIDNSDILVESLYDGSDRLIKSKKWDKTFFLSCEPHNIDGAIDEYDVVLASMSMNDKVVNMPEFLIHIYEYNLIDQLETRHLNPRTDIAKNEIIVFISNSTEVMTHVRNAFLDELDKHFKVDYGGKYKNNTGIDLQWDRHDKLDEMLEIIKQYKIVITMENTKDKYVDTYITEKIIHGLCTHVVPVYWGTDKVTEYFNKDSMIIYDGQNMDDVFNQIRFLMDNDDEWLKKVNVPVFPNYKLTRTIDDIASDVKKRGII